MEAVRTVVYIVAVLWAVSRVHYTGNYSQVRVYLYALLGDAIATGTYAYFWGTLGIGYWLVYTVSFTIVAVAALNVAVKALSFAPTFLAKITGSIAITSAVLSGMLVWVTSDRTPHTLVVILEGSLIAAAGVMTLHSARMADRAYRDTFATLGALWLVQMGFFYTYAAGVSWNAAPWQWLGEWVPTTIIVAALGKLGWEFRRPELTLRSEEV